MFQMRTQTHASKTKLLDAALQVFRTKGYTATTVDDICNTAGVTKGSFFHHFKGKEELAIESTRYWTEVTSGLFATAPYQQIADPRERVLAYIDFRAQILQGNLPDFTCLLGTMVQETFETHPAIRDACWMGIDAHAQTIAKDVAQARALYAPGADWTAEGLAHYTQAALQGAFILAKAQGGAGIAAECVAHVHRYVEMLLGVRAPGSLSAERHRAEKVIPSNL
jgi:TetR/AcrR family transcriptional regulator, transcriptional repressor for nem operon